MLETLRRLVQEISSAANLSDALQILVKRVREAINTDACTIFLIDRQHQEYVLLATEGLNPNVVGKIRLKINEGLVGLVGQREELINLENAAAHPNFYYVPEAHEERFKAFLGVPIIHHRQLLGVLMVQHIEQRRFNETEEAFLVTISAQLGGVLAHAEATGAIGNLLKNSSTHPQRHDLVFSGAASVPGIGIGHAVVIYPLADLSAVPMRRAVDITLEASMLKKALRQTRTDVRRLKKRLSHLPTEERALFDAYLKILDSESLENEILTEIQNGIWAQGALCKIIQEHIQRFEVMKDDYISKRAADLRDLGQRILLHLQKESRVSLIYPAQTILIGEEISVSAVAEVPKNKLVGILSKKGSTNSHVAILARALNIPIIIGIEDLPITQLEGQEIIIDGYQGRFYLAPSAKLRANFTALLKQQHEVAAHLEKLRDLPAQTLDGHHVSLLVNSGLVADATISLASGAEGVGLYRTEMLFMSQERFPSEQEQYLGYRQLLGIFAPRPVTMRTLDVGGDKALSYFPITEENPFLGWRGIRITLDQPEIFLLQIRAMLRAHKEFNNLRIMLPMVSSVQETDEAIKLIRQAHRELKAEGLTINLPPIGVMIEVPSAIYQIPELAERVDFLSVGSNDLTQYLLAVDRTNLRVANLYDALHPAVIRVLVQIVTAAHQANKPISICGELASDPLAIPLLLAIGFDALSMNSVSLPKVKWIIRNLTLEQAKDLLAKILRLDNPIIIRQYLAEVLRNL